MKFFWSRESRSLNDPDFGKITEWRRGCWKGIQCKLWNYLDVEVLLDADENGPSSAQRLLYRDLRANEGGIRERIEQGIRQQIADAAGLMVSATNPIKLSTIFFPYNPPDETWRVWYDLQGEEVYWFGAEIRNSQQIVPFCED